MYNEREVTHYDEELGVMHRLSKDVIDNQHQHGFFHFDRYPEDLGEWMCRKATLSRTGDELAIGRAIALTMAESVAFVHA